MLAFSHFILLHQLRFLSYSLSPPVTHSSLAPFYCVWICFSSLFLFFISRFSLSRRHSSTFIFFYFIVSYVRVFAFICFVLWVFLLLVFVLFVSISYICLLAKCLFDSPFFRVSFCFLSSIFPSFTFLPLDFVFFLLIHVLPFLYFLVYSTVTITLDLLLIFSHMSLASKFIHNKVYSSHKDSTARTLLLFSGNFSVSQES